MNDLEEELKKVFIKASKLVEELPDGLKAAAFKIAVAKLLQTGSTELSSNIAKLDIETVKHQHLSNNSISDLDSLEIEANLKDFPKLYGLKKGQQILWMLIYCGEKGISELSTSEISRIAAKFKLDIPAKNVPALSETSFSKGYLALKNGKMRILQPGIEFLKAINKSE